MPPKRSLEDLRRRLRDLQADVDETINALDSGSREQPRAAAPPSVALPVRRRPVREVVLEYLEDLGWPATGRELSAYAAARYGRELSSERFGSLSADERTAYATGSVRPVWLCHALNHERGDVVRRLWTRSDWPLDRRVVAPTTARVRHLRLTARLCEIAREAETDPGRLHHLAAEQAEDLPGVDVRPDRYDLETWRDAALAELAHVEPADQQQRSEAADRLGQRLTEAEQLFGAPDPPERPRRAPASGPRPEGAGTSRSRCAMSVVPQAFPRAPSRGS